VNPPEIYTLSGPLRWHDFDGEWVVFGTATGALRHLDGLTAAVLAALEDAPATASAVAQRMAEATEVELGNDMVGGIVGLLEELQRNGLVERRQT